MDNERYAKEIVTTHDNNIFLFIKNIEIALNEDDYIKVINYTSSFNIYMNTFNLIFGGKK